MACCGKKPNRNSPIVDKRGNSLRKYMYLNPKQRKLLEAEDKEKQEDSNTND